MSRVPPKTRLSAAARRTQLLDLAEDLFTDRGYEGVSIEDVARAADVTRPVVYQHFDGKEALFIACVRRARDQFESDLAEAVGSAIGDLPDLIEAGGRVFFEVLARDPRRWALLFATSSSIDGKLSEQLSALRVQTIASIADLCRPFAPNVPEDDLAALAHAISGIGEQLGRWWLRNAHLSLDEVVLQHRLLVSACANATLDRFSTGDMRAV